MQVQQLHRTAVTTSTGLSSNHHTPAPRIFPNPCTDRRTILCDPSPSFRYTTIALHDATGRAIARPAAQWQTDRLVLGMVGVASGTYLLSFTQGEMRQVVPVTVR
jgi:hypothetical protein